MEDKYLKQFCIAISSDNEISKSSFIQLYKTSITHFTPYLKTEIQENLIRLDNSKIEIYINYVISTIENTPFYAYNTDIFEKEISDYNVKLDNFPLFSEGKLYHHLNKGGYPNFFVYNKNEDDYKQLQLNAFAYACRLEAQKIIQFIKDKNQSFLKSNNNFKKIKWRGKPSQLGFLIGQLASLGYIETPEKSNGEINYTQFANELLEVFDINTTPATLSKYLNLDSEKSQEVSRKFEKEEFHIPNRKIVS